MVFIYKGNFAKRDLTNFRWKDTNPQKKARLMFEKSSEQKGRMQVPDAGRHARMLEVSKDIRVTKRQLTFLARLSCTQVLSSKFLIRKRSDSGDLKSIRSCK